MDWNWAYVLKQNFECLDYFNINEMSMMKSMQQRLLVKKNYIASICYIFINKIFSHTYS